jgi:hypothetical protein
MLSHKSRFHVEVELHRHISITSSSPLSSVHDHCPSPQLPAQDKCKRIKSLPTFTALASFFAAIVNHVQALARRVEELMAFEKFKPRPEDELRAYFFGL